MIRFKTTITLLVVILFTINSLSAQNSTVGHVVVKGDNVYRLSLKYDVTMNSIFNLNSGSKTLIKIGETLIIPNLSTALNQQTLGKPNTYKVVRGDTKYGLSKKYKISIARLEEVNPHIKNMLMAGIVITLPTLDENQSGPNITNQETSIHIVKSGETLWTISQKYNMYLLDLKRLNKKTLNGSLKIGEELLIRTTSANTENPKTYTVIKGDTKYGLSKRFKLTITELETLNPDIVPMLKSGAKITISENKNALNESSIKTSKDSIITNNTTTKNLKKEYITSSIDTLNTSRNGNYEKYIIKSKETLFGLATRANMSIINFLELNPNLKKSVLEGDTIKMPINKNSIVSKNTYAETNSRENNNSTELNIEILWENFDTITNSGTKKQKANYYVGLRQAIDILKKERPNSNLVLSEDYIKNLGTKNDNSLNNLKPKVFISHLDNIKDKDYSFEALGTLTLNYKYKDSINRIIVNGLANKETMRNRVISYLKKQNGHVICVYDKDHKENIEYLKTVIPDTEFITTKQNGSYKSKDLISALKTNKKNFVIIESDKVGVYLSSTNTLLKEMSTVKIQLVVLNSNNIPSNTLVTNKRFNILKLLYPKLYDPNLNKGLNEATALGYSLNYDILKRLFKAPIETFDTSETTSKLGFDYRYQLNNGVYENQYVPLFIFDEKSDTTPVIN